MTSPSTIPCRFCGKLPEPSCEGFLRCVNRGVCSIYGCEMSKEEWEAGVVRGNTTQGRLNKYTRKVDAAMELTIGRFQWAHNNQPVLVIRTEGK